MVNKVTALAAKAMSYGDDGGRALLVSTPDGLPRQALAILFGLIANAQCGTSVVIREPWCVVFLESMLWSGISARLAVQPGWLRNHISARWRRLGELARRLIALEKTINPTVMLREGAP